jgi:hypothetical protein
MRVIMKRSIIFSPPVIALAVAAVCVVVLVATIFGSTEPHSETMFSASTTGSSVDAAGATITPTHAGSN